MGARQRKRILDFDWETLMKWISKLTPVATVPLIKAVMVGIVGMTLVLTGCEKFALDRQMEELCKKDGGVKVYETVTLPVSMFDQWGDPFPGWRAKVLQGKPEERLGSEYRYVVETIYLKQGDPLKGEGRLDRTSERIYRRDDGKLIGEAISYGRSGGDFIAYAHPTSKSCPVAQSESDLIRSVFIKNGK
jgi:hypothetical protein